MPLSICTIIAKNYLPFARVLTRSFLHHNPQGSVYVMIVDEQVSETYQGEEFSALVPGDLPIDQREFESMAMIYNVMELATAVKPFVLDLLRTKLEQTVFYFDPDIAVFGSLECLLDDDDSASMVLTPHASEPYPLDGLNPTDGDILSCGIYNLGFIGVGSQSGPFLDWWKSRLRRDCISSLEEGLFVDQRFVDLGVVLFPTARVLRDPGMNVAYWNADQRRLTKGAGDLYYAGDSPLRFFHFSGYKPESSHVLSVHQRGMPRLPLGDSAVLQELCDWYRSELLVSGYGEGGVSEYRWGRSASGTFISPRLRRLYREELLRSEKYGGYMPSAFAHGDARDFDRWADPLVSRMPDKPNDLAHRLRREVVQRLPGGARLQLRAAADRLHRWRGQLTAESPSRASSAMASRLPMHRPGVNLVGYLTAESGVGMLGRALARGVSAAGCDLHPIVHRGTHVRQGDTDFAQFADAEAVHDINILSVNADSVELTAKALGPSFFRGRRTVGMWAWELDRIPASHAQAAELLDEIWVPSRFVAESVGIAVDKPVLRVPVPVVTPSDEDESQPSGPFEFFFMFDYYSVFERKNPLGVIRSYCDAFPGSGGETRLHIKAVNGDRYPKQKMELESAASVRDDIVISESYLSSDDLSRQLRRCDCYVSLHRSEGFGFTMAEAMAAGKPVIATGYSGNMDFMTSWNSFVVPYQMVDVGDDAGPYPPDARWADPDLAAAAAMMRTVFEDTKEADRRAKAGQLAVCEEFSVEALADFVRRRLPVLALG